MASTNKSFVCDAAMKGDQNLMRILVRAGVNINETDENGNTAIVYSLRNRDLDMTSFLIDEGADLNMTTCDGKSISEIINESGYEVGEDGKLVSWEYENLDNFLDSNGTKNISITEDERKMLIDIGIY